MDKHLRPCSALEGEVTPPGDKSISHRAAILNSLATGRASVSNYSPGADCLATLDCLRALGVDIEASEERDGYSLVIAGGRPLVEASAILDASNSGTTMRLLTGLFRYALFFFTGCCVSLGSGWPSSPPHSL